MALCFPATLKTAERHKSILAFNAVENVDRFKDRTETFGIINSAKTNSVGSVYLYMPSLGDVVYSQEFSTDPPSMIEKIAGIIMKNSSGDINIGEIAKEGAAAIGGALGGGLRDMVSSDISNPHTTARYKGPTLRTQTFSFDLYPKSIEELTTISEIIMFFKYHSSPQLGPNSSAPKAKPADSGIGASLIAAMAQDRLKYPAVWTIEEIPSAGANKRLLPFKFGPAYLKTVSIGYNEIMFNTGDPVHITIKLDFVESQMLTKAEISSGF